MKTYKVTIEEILRRVVEVEAESPEQAVAKAESAYRAEEHVLSDSDYAGTDIYIPDTSDDIIPKETNKAGHDLEREVRVPLDEQLEALRRHFVDKLRMLPLRPVGWLPHVVYVEEEGDYPVYTRYKLEEIRPGGTCTLVNDETGERFTDRRLDEINVDWLDTVCRWYHECCLEQNLWKEHALLVLRRECEGCDEVINQFVDSFWLKLRPDEENTSLFYKWLMPDSPVFAKNKLLKFTDDAIRIVRHGFGDAAAQS